MPFGFPVWLGTGAYASSEGFAQVLDGSALALCRRIEVELGVIGVSKAGVFMVSISRAMDVPVDRVVADIRGWLGFCIWACLKLEVLAPPRGKLGWLIRRDPLSRQTM